MVTQSGILVWRIPWTEEPGGLPQGQQPARAVFAKRFWNVWLVSDISGELCGAEL